MNNSTNVATLKGIVERVENAGINVAPNYKEYMTLGFAIANACGEAGRTYFHSLCSPSERYIEADANKLYTEALKKGNGSNSLGTVWHIVEKAGVDLKGLSCSTDTLTTPDDMEEMTDDELFDVPETSAPAQSGRRATHKAQDKLLLDQPPTFPDYEWPQFIQRGIKRSDKKPQQDVLLLSMITTLGATASDLLEINYDTHPSYPCLQTFIVAPPASGKSAMGWAAQLAQPIQEEREDQWAEQWNQYLEEKAIWESQAHEHGKEHSKKMPRVPARKYFLIPGDNTGTGILDNLMDQDGLGMICESEASILSAAINSDFGNWSHTLRKAFDHDRIAFNRRTDHEQKVCRCTRLSVLISGTPGQVKPLIQSTEDGLFSRQVFYFMPPVRQWQRLKGRPVDQNKVFAQWGERWKVVLEALHRHVSMIELSLSEEMRDDMQDRLERIFAYSGATYGDYMAGTVLRMGINLSRIMAVVGLMRSLDHLMTMEDGRELDAALEDMTSTLLASPGLEPADGVLTENVTDRVFTRFKLTLTQADYEAVMALAEPLFRHACYACALLPRPKVSAPKAQSKKQKFMSQLAVKFDRQQAIAAAADLGMSAAACDVYLRRMVDSGFIKKVGHGAYQFTSKGRTERTE